MRYAVSDEPGLICKVRIPLTGKTGAVLAAQAIEHPQHVLTIEGSFLVMRHG